MKSIEQLEAARGGLQTFNDLIRELMLSVVTSLWVEYLTEIEELRSGIGLQAFAQRDPLVEYKRRAFEMFQDLYSRIRSQTVSNVFTYQYRGLARLEEEDRDRAARQVIEAPRVKATAVGVAQKTQVRPAKQKAEVRRTEPTRVPERVGTATSLGRNDPCWCGSGKKYKHCHMQSDLK